MIIKGEVAMGRQHGEPISCLILVNKSISRLSMSKSDRKKNFLPLKAHGTQGCSDQNERSVFKVLYRVQSSREPVSQFVFKLTSKHDTRKRSGWKEEVIN